MQCPSEWKEEPEAKFMCHICKKSFYNPNALQNHKNTQHDFDKSESDVEHNAIIRCNEESFHGLYGFKFIPLKVRSETDQTSIADELTTRTYSADTTYLIVKVEGNDADSDAMKRSKIDGGSKKTQIKQKQTVDLRGPFTCTFPSALLPDLQCRQIFFNCCDYSLHYREEHTKRRKAALRCQVCEKPLDKEVYPEKAIVVQPPAPLTYTCRPCGEIFIGSAEYIEHNRLFHYKVKPHQCSICSKRFTQQGGLQQHMRMHTGIRPFACTFCPKAFTQKAGLDQHLRTHTKVKPFKCVICSKCFSQSVHLRQHMRTHTNIQPFECTVCGRRFKQSSHLNFHMRSHIDEGTLFMDNYAQFVQQDKQLELLNLQPVHDGIALYYAAELASESTISENTFSYHSPVLSNSVL